MRNPANPVVVSIRRLHMDRDQATAIIGRVGVVVWRGATTVAAVDRVREMGIELLNSAGVPACIVGVVEQTATAPQSDGRIASARVNDELAERGVVGYAGVIPRAGIAGAWIRGVITALHLLARKRYPFRVFESSPEASKWLVTLIDVSPSNHKAIAAALDEFRQQYQQAWSAGFDPAADGTASPAA